MKSDFKIVKGSKGFWELYFNHRNYPDPFQVFSTRREARRGKDLAYWGVFNHMMPEYILS